MIKKSKKKGGKSTSNKGIGHFAEMTEDFSRHDVGKKKHKEIKKAHIEEYSPAQSHSMSHVETFRSHAGSKHHQKDLLAVEKKMGIKVNVRHYGKEAARERAAAEFPSMDPHGGGAVHPPPQPTHRTPAPTSPPSRQETTINTRYSSI